MAFKIKDLMINIAGKRSPEACAGHQTHPQPCPDYQTHGQECLGHQTHRPECPENQTHGQECLGHQTHWQECFGRQTHGQDCAGHQTHPQALAGNNEVAFCVGGRTEIALCIGAKTFAAVQPDKGTAPVCFRCTAQTHGAFSPACDAGEILDGLNAIKAELQAELARLDSQIKDIEDTLKPKTVAEVEELQTKLQEALDELGKMKADMEKN